VKRQENGIGKGIGYRLHLGGSPMLHTCYLDLFEPGWRFTTSHRLLAPAAVKKKSCPESAVQT